MAENGVAITSNKNDAPTSTLKTTCLQMKKLSLMRKKMSKS
ncbi:hypothetical protein ACB092_04G093300 [Castanea dentata]